MNSEKEEFEEKLNHEDEEDKKYWDAIASQLKLTVTCLSDWQAGNSEQMLSPLMKTEN